MSNVLFDRVRIIKDEKDFIYHEDLDLYNVSFSSHSLKLTYLLPYQMGFDIPVKFGLVGILIKPFSLISDTEVKHNEKNYKYFESLVFKGYKIQAKDRVLQSIDKTVNERVYTVTYKYKSMP